MRLTFFVVLWAITLPAWALEPPKSFVARVDSEFQRSIGVLKSGEPRAIGEQARRWNAIREEGEHYGNALTGPQGNCGALAIFAQSWWTSQVTRNEIAIKSNYEQALAHKKACLNSQPVKSDCLTVYDMDDQGNMIELPKPSHCTQKSQHKKKT